MGDDQKACNTGLHLGLGIEDFEPKMKEENNKGQAAGKSSGLSFSLLMKEEEETAIEAKLNGSSFDGWNEKKDKYRHQRDVTGFMVQSKKLRLTKEQSSLLESSFKFHNTLNPDDGKSYDLVHLHGKLKGQKQALSKQLNLKPRQVEVWFQNRRARTKLKQTESEHELLKKWCGSLREENRRLKMELQNLRCRKVGSASLYGHQISKANTISTCPSCKTMMWPSTDDSKKCSLLE